MTISAETFYGFIETTADALLVFEGCKSGLLHKVPKRLTETQRIEIRSGSVFCYDERQSGIKRWTDGRLWSPSRIVGNFLVYKELEKKLPRSTSKHEIEIQANRFKSSKIISSSKGTFVFKEKGLIKKTMSLVIDGIQQHLVSYYLKEDVKTEKLGPVRQDPRLAHLIISQSLISSQNFRRPPTEAIKRLAHVESETSISESSNPFTLFDIFDTDLCSQFDEADYSLQGCFSDTLADFGFPAPSSSPPTSSETIFDVSEMVDSVHQALLSETNLELEPMPIPPTLFPIHYMDWTRDE